MARALAVRWPWLLALGYAIEELERVVYRALILPPRQQSLPRLIDRITVAL